MWLQLILNLFQNYSTHWLLGLMIMASALANFNVIYPGRLLTNQVLRGHASKLVKLCVCIFISVTLCNYVVVLMHIYFSRKGPDHTHLKFFLNPTPLGRMVPRRNNFSKYTNKEINNNYKSINKHHQVNIKQSTI